MTSKQQIPPGYALHNTFSGFETRCGPLFIKRDPDQTSVAVQVREEHISGGETLHGGFGMALAEIAMREATRPLVDGDEVSTVSLNMEFAGPAVVGDIIEAAAEIYKEARTVTFARGNVVCGDQILMNFSGVVSKRADENAKTRNWKPAISGTPDGFKTRNATVKFENLTGPYYIKPKDGSEYGFGFPVEDYHCDGRGLAHPGMLLGFADMAFGSIGRNAFKERTNGTTVTMVADFLSEARLGEFVESEGDVVWIADRFFCMRGLLKVGARPIMRFSSVFKGSSPK